MESALSNILLFALPVIFAITVHEAAHAWVANYFGDATARQLGRVSFNPVVHIDLFGTLILPAVLVFLGSSFLIGYAKPVPVNYGNLRNPKKQMGFVALAGPAANLAMAWMWAVWGDLLRASGMGNESFFLKMAAGGVVVNLVLCVFNLFPLPPLDGGRIMVSLLPHRLAASFSRIEPFGFFIVLLLVFNQWLSFWMTPMLALTSGIIHLLTSPFSFFLN